MAVRPPCGEVVTGLTLLLIVDVRGVVFYLAWAAIGLALLSETAAMVVYWRQLATGPRRLM